MPAMSLRPSTAQFYDADLVDLDGLGIALEPYFITSTTEYDELNRVHIVTDGINPNSTARVTTNEYDANGMADFQIDSIGRKLDFDYDMLGRRTKVTEADNTALARTTETEYDQVGNVSTVTDPLGRVTQYEYDARNQVVSMTEAFGIVDVQRSTTYEYDARGNLEYVHAPRWADFEPISIEEVREVVTKYEYDINDRVKKVIEGWNLTPELWTPGADGAMTALLPHARPVTEYEYNAAGEITLMTEPDGSSTRKTKYTYDIYGRTTETLEGWQSGEFLLGTYLRGTRMGYDAADNTTFETVGGSASGTGFDPFAYNVLRSQSSYSFDALGRLVSKTEAAHDGAFSSIGGDGVTVSPVTKYSYDAADNVLRETDPRNHWTQFTYTAFNEVKTEQLAADTFGTSGDISRLAEYEYDNAGRMTKSTLTGKDQFLTTFVEFDELNREVSTITEPWKGASRLSTFEYDLVDNKTAMVDPLDRRTEWEYDDLNRVIRVTQAVETPVERTTLTQYDAADNVIRIASQRVYSPSINSTSDLFSLPASQVEVTKYGYDGLNRMTLKIDGATATLALPGSSPTADQLEHPVPVTRWQYDSSGRVILELSPVRDLSTTGHAHAIRTTYDAVDQVIQTEEGNYTFVTGAFSSLRKSLYGYDAVGDKVYEEVNRSTSGDPNRPMITRHTFDTLGREITTRQQIDFGTTALVTVRKYDEGGNLLLVVQQGTDPGTPAQGRATRFDYDALNRLTTKTEAASYSDADFVSVGFVPVADSGLPALGHASPVWQYEYDGFDNQIKSTDPLGVWSTTEYDSYGQLTKQTLAAGRAGTQPVPLAVIPVDQRPVTTWVYDAGGQLESMTDAVGTTTNYFFDELGRQNRVVEAVGTALERETQTTYRADDLAQSVRTVSAISQQFVGSKTLPYSFEMITGYEYDPLGRVRKVTPQSGLTASQYSALQLGHTQPGTEYRYDGIGNIVEIRTNVSGSNNSSGDLLSITRFGYDDLFRQISTSEGITGTGDTAIARVTETRYDSIDNVVWMRDGNQVATAFGYDLLGRRTLETVGVDPYSFTEQNPSPLTTTYVFNAFGDQVSVIPPVASQRTDYQYDRLGRLVKIITAKVGTSEWQRTEFGYDAAGHKLTTNDIVHPSWYEGDKDNKTVVGPVEGVMRVSTTIATYDWLGRVVSVKNPEGKISTTRYDRLGRVELERDPESGGDNLGNGIFRSTNRYREYEYDALGRKVREYWLTKTSTNGKGQIAPTLSVSVDNVITNVFDSANHLVYTFEAVNPSTTVHSPEDAAKLRVTASSIETWSARPLTWTLNSYDVFSRVSFTESGATGKLTYHYDAVGRTITVGDASGGVKRTQYDLAGRVTVRESSAPGQTGTYVSIDYFHKTTVAGSPLIVRDLPSGMIERTLPAGRTGPSGPIAVLSSSKYDSQGREVERGWWNPAAFGHKELLGTTYYTDGAYAGLVKSEQRTSVVALGDGNFSAEFSYGPRGQLTVAKYIVNGVDQNNKAAVLDAAGNSPFNDKNAAMSSGGYQSAVANNFYLRYDEYGNVIQYSTAPSLANRDPWPIYVMSYDTRNRLSKVEVIRIIPGPDKPNGGREPSTRELAFSHTYTYDTLDRLIARDVYYPQLSEIIDENGTIASHGPGTESERYQYDGRNPYADQNGSGTITARYLIGTMGELLTRIDSTRPLFYLTDRQKSILQITDATGNLIKRVRYEGTEAKWRGTTDTSFHDRYELGGLRLDYIRYSPTVGIPLALSGSAWLDTNTGRFLSQTGAGLGLNPYPFANNNFVNEGADEAKPSLSWWDSTWVGAGVNDVWAGVKAVYNGPSTGGLGWWDRNVYGRLGEAYNASDTFRRNYDALSAGMHFAGGIGEVFTFGQLSKINEYNGYDVRYMNRADSLAWGAGEAAGTIMSVVVGGGVAGGASATGRAGLIARNVLRYQVSGGLFTAGEGVFEAYRDYSAGKGVSWMTGLKIAGGLLGARMDAGALQKANALGKLGRGTLALTEIIEQPLLAAVSRTAGKVAGSPVGRAAGDLARWVSKLGPEAREGARWAERNLPTLNKALDNVIHGGLSKVSKRLHDTAADVANWLGFKACFAAGTPLRTPTGSRLIEDIRVGDLVLSRDEHDPNGLVVAQTVEEVFVREALVLNLHLPQGVVIRTTAEHPFYEKSKGWVACQELVAGEELLCEDGSWVSVGEVFDTGCWETVYNLRVADFHTYFVGCDEWGFAVWAHNAYTAEERAALHDALRGKVADVRARDFVSSVEELGLSHADALAVAQSKTGQALLHRYSGEDVALDLAEGGMARLESRLSDYVAERGGDLLFGQKRAAQAFNMTSPNPHVAGKTIEEVAAALNDGLLDPSIFRISVFKDGAGRQVVANNRGMAALALAKMEPTSIIRRAPSADEAARLVEAPIAKKYSLPGDTLPITTQKDGGGLLYEAIINNSLFR